MKAKSAVLEYCVAKTNGGTVAQWGFRFKAPDGQTLMESVAPFDSLAKAEEGFISVIKLIATNQYIIDCPEFPELAQV
jgi:hypothetical protein